MDRSTLVRLLRRLADEAEFIAAVDAEVALDDFADKVPCDAFYHRVAERLIVPCSPAFRLRVRRALRHRHGVVKSNTRGHNFLRYAHAWRLKRGAPSSALDRDP